MKFHKWNQEKNNWLKKNRHISFEEVIFAIKNESVIKIVKHPNSERYPDQKMYIIEYLEYVYLVPFVETEDEIFLKTIIPSRKATKQFLRGGKDGK